jgi:multidrug transporter EmrE-like cation transporter
VVGWILLAAAIVSEVCGTLSLKVADGFRRPGFMVVVVLCYGVSFAMLALAAEVDPGGAGIRDLVGCRDGDGSGRWRCAVR